MKAVYASASPFARALVAVFGGTLIVQALAFARQIVVAAAFGVTRDMDFYSLVYAVAALSVFIFSSIFDTVGVPRLTQAHAAGKAEFQSFASRYLGFSILFGAIISAAFFALTPLLMPIVGAGLTDAEAKRAVALSLSFVPWTLLCLPYYALGSIMKSERRFRRPIVAEIVVVTVSLLALFAAPSRIESLPLAYAAGYGAGILTLLPGLGVGLRAPSLSAQAGQHQLFRNFTELFLANQVSSVSSIVERFLMSFLQAGAIASYQYCSLITTNAATLLAFREVFIVPLSQDVNRKDRLERVEIGLAVLSIPAAIFLALEAPLIVEILFQRGKFDAAAVRMTADYLQILAFSIVPGAMAPPLARMFQILDRIKFMGVVYILYALGMAIVGSLLVLRFHWGIRGFALASLLASTISFISIIVLLARCGLALNWRRIGFFVGIASVASGTGAFLLWVTPRLENAYFELLTNGALFSAPIIFAYALVRKQLFAIIR